MNWVRDLREMGSEGAPGYVETRLRAAFRERSARRPLWMPIAVAATVVMAVGLGFWITRPAERIEAPPVLAARATPPRTAFAKAPRAPVRKSAIRNPQSAMVQEVATDFYPLQYVADAGVLGNGTVVRVSMPRAAMTTFGFPVDIERRQEPIQADVVLGGDGMARAIRFVQQQRIR